jgi:hypothetical protein
MKVLWKLHHQSQFIRIILVSMSKYVLENKDSSDDQTILNTMHSNFIEYIENPENDVSIPRILKN